ncbi:MAG: hypothetical protein DCC66_03070 [Planctomycetota bacterium]|nr:MAG: hypothetical protein DCC66_03070 [Planctomycetota bacterium]
MNVLPIDPAVAVHITTARIPHEKLVGADIDAAAHNSRLAVNLHRLGSRQKNRITGVDAGRRD